MKYIMISKAEAHMQDLPGSDYWDADGEGHAIYLRHDDGFMEYIGQDGGEPEDQTFVRDWSWVLAALNRALEL